MKGVRIMKVIRSQTLGVTFLLLFLLFPLTSIARFLSVDPHAGNYPSITPYAYSLNTPIKFVDPDGKDAFLYTWAPKGKQVGHSAIGTQIRDANGAPTGQVRVRHLWPAQSVGKSQVAPTDYRTAVVSESDLSAFSGGEGRGADAITRIVGDMDQDNAINAALDQAETNKTYDAQTNNCATYTATGLQAADVSTGTGGTVKVKKYGFTIKQLNNATTPVSVHNGATTSNDPRVQPVVPLPSDRQSPDIEIHL